MGSGNVNMECFEMRSTETDLRWFHAISLKLISVFSMSQIFATEQNDLQIPGVANLFFQNPHVNIFSASALLIYSLTDSIYLLHLGLHWYAFSMIPLHALPP